MKQIYVNGMSPDDTVALMVVCDRCKGSGEDLSKPVVDITIITCPDCNGEGHVIRHVPARQLGVV